jgi:uncharacterized protein YlxW (UPF0749 family)
MRIDASLDSLLSDALTSDYPSTEDAPAYGRFGILVVAAATTVVTVVLGMAIADTRLSNTENLQTRSALAERVLAADRRVQSLEVTVLTAQDALLDAERAALAGTSLGDQARSRLERLRIASGQTEITGQGVSVTMDNSPSTGQDDGALIPGQIIDRDLQIIVNGLWQAGATDIAINGRRLTGTSAIRAAGDAILVNYRPLSPPYVITAIGPDPDRLAGLFRENSAGLLLEELESQFGVIWELQTIGEVTLPAAGPETKSSEDAP